MYSSMVISVASTSLLDISYSVVYNLKRVLHVAEYTVNSGINLIHLGAFLKPAKSIQYMRVMKPVTKLCNVGFLKDGINSGGHV